MNCRKADWDEIAVKRERVVGRETERQEGDNMRREDVRGRWEIRLEERMRRGRREQK